jgi:hypothetical protein
MLWALRLKILYIYIYIFELKVIGKRGRKGVKGHWKGPKKSLLKE